MKSLPLPPHFFRFTLEKKKNVDLARWVVEIKTSWSWWRVGVCAPFGPSRVHQNSLLSCSNPFFFSPTIFFCLPILIRCLSIDIIKESFSPPSLPSPWKKKNRLYSTTYSNMLAFLFLSPTVSLNCSRIHLWNRHWGYVTRKNNKQ